MIEALSAHTKSRRRAAIAAEFFSGRRAECMRSKKTDISIPRVRAVRSCMAITRGLTLNAEVTSAFINQAISQVEGYRNGTPIVDEDDVIRARNWVNENKL